MKLIIYTTLLFRVKMLKFDIQHIAVCHLQFTVKDSLVFGTASINYLVFYYRSK